MILGEKTLREMVLSKIEQSKERPSTRDRTLRPRLRLVTREVAERVDASGAVDGTNGTKE